jgi:hypothetical protein
MIFSKGLQIAVFGFLIVIILLYMKHAAMTQRVSQLESNMGNFVTNENYMATFQNVLEEKLRDYQCPSCQTSDET